MHQSPEEDLEQTLGRTPDTEDIRPGTERDTTNQAAGYQTDTRRATSNALLNRAQASSDAKA